MSAVLEKKQVFWVDQFEKLINKVLQFDDETLDALGQLGGKVFAFEFINTRLLLFLFPSEQGLTICTSYDEKPDVWIKGTPSNFIIMLTSSKKGISGIPADLQIIGDISLAQQFQKIMQSIEIDLEEPLSKWVGDTIAYRMGRFFRGSRKIAFNTINILIRDLSEYLRFEVEMLPDDLLVEEFCNAVDCLREDTDRLTQRINKLEAKLNKQK